MLNGLGLNPLLSCQLDPKHESATHFQTICCSYLALCDTIVTLLANYLALRKTLELSGLCPAWKGRFCEFASRVIVGIRPTRDESRVVLLDSTDRCPDITAGYDSSQSSICNPSIRLK
jgi:hypothetical protein